MVVLWALGKARDIDHDLTHGDFLSIEDAEDLADFLGLTAADQERRVERDAEAPRAPKVVSIESVRPHPRKLKRPERTSVDAAEIAARVRWVAAYIEWHLNRRIGSLERQQRASEELRTLGPLVINRLRQLAPRTTPRSDDELALEGVGRDVLLRIEEALVPGAPENPFTPGFVQSRNYLLWRLLLDSGARRHEVREAKADHVQYGARRFEIHVSKTIARTVPIAPKTAEAFDAFIEHHWSKLPKEARRRGHLFTDEHGRHLSLRAMNRVFERVREQVGGVPDFMAPHTVRRSWNDNFSATIDSLPENERPSHSEEVKMRNRLQGWSGESSMGARYARRHTKRKADQIAEKMMDSMSVPNAPKRSASREDNK
ncbi:site-specific integrase [Azospirillum sp. HJ39]|uniref:tyrosine-type recombinase/integrase n=1 Tax=Azospirillum sp. HJ39 TaxID=3159496 RepID=UPI0035583427